MLKKIGETNWFPPHPNDKQEMTKQKRAHGEAHCFGMGYDCV
jgi:hypothetical protein